LGGGGGRSRQTCSFVVMQSVVALWNCRVSGPTRTIFNRLVVGERVATKGHEKNFKTGRDCL
jgi:hypothetical protein